MFTLMLFAVGKQSFAVTYFPYGFVLVNCQPHLGGYCSGVPPLPIPNREVKPACADGTAILCGRVGDCPLSLKKALLSTTTRGLLCLFDLVVFISLMGYGNNRSFLLPNNLRLNIVYDLLLNILIFQLNRLRY